MVNDHGQPARRTYGRLGRRKHVFGFVDVWGGILSRLQPKDESAMLNKSRTIYGRFAYLATLMVESVCDVKVAAEEELMHGSESSTMSHPKTPSHGRGPQLLDSSSLGPLTLL